MYSKSSGKASKGTIGIRPVEGRLWFNLPRGWSKDKKQIKLPVGLSDTPEGWRDAKELAARMERDFSLGALPETKEWIKAKYLSRGIIQPSDVSQIKPEPSLGEVWNAYLEHLRVLEQKEALSPNTLSKSYKTFTNYIFGTKSRKGEEIKLPTLDIARAGEIKDYCERVIPADSCKRFIYRLGKACNWAIENGMITANPFTALARTVTLPAKDSEDDDIDPFTAEERDAILEALISDRFCSKYARVKHSYYYNWMFFLFKTGCRTGESIVLRWKDISEDFQFITFSRSIAKSERGGRVEKNGLKKQKKRRFGRCTPELSRFLESIKSADCDPESLVFPPPKGDKWLDPHNFSNRIWRGENGEKGLLDHLGIPYRKLYQTRHTFITLVLENKMPIRDVARLVGNSVSMIEKHYAGNLREMDIPEC